MNKNSNFRPLVENSYVAVAENVIKNLNTPNEKGRKESQISTSKIRGLLSNISEIYNYIMLEKTPEELESKIQYLKIQFVYEAGRDKVTKKFIEKSDILNHLDDIKNNKEKFILFEKYMEALVAYHKYYGGE